MNKVEEKDTQTEPNKNRWLTFLAGSILVILYLSLCAIVLASTFSREISLPNSNNEIATSTATVIPTPQILFDQIQNKNRVRFENFTSNYRNWGIHYYSGKIEIINEKMIFQSNIEDIAIVTNEIFLNTSDIYYLQADLITDTVVDYQQYGLIFGFNGPSNSFYLFEVDPNYQSFRLFKYAPSSDYQVSNSVRHIPNHWIMLIDYTTADMNQYPKENTLGVSFNKGIIELFINGNQVATYVDEQPLQFSGVGVYVNNYGYRLIVDNFFGYSE